MTQASPVLPGAVYHLVRRTEGRYFTLTPTYRPAFGSGKESADTVKDIYEYATAVASIKSGVQVVAWCVMSNHIHVSPAQTPLWL
jgi:REP element-mobilizing transposase RayT